MTTPLFDYGDTTDEWLYRLHGKLGMFEDELRAKVLASIVAELARRGLGAPKSGERQQ